MNTWKLCRLLAIAGALMLSATDEASALPVQYVNVQPIQVCDNGGGNCANSLLQLFLAETDKIWAQADIDVVFLPWMTVNSSAQLNEDNFGDLTNNANADIVNMWFVESLSECGGPADPTSLFGCGGSGHVAITDLVFSYLPNGRLDTIAHELGHVLGLGHGDFGAGGDDNLMTQGSTRDIPDVIGDINPDGLGLDKLTQAQIDEARNSSFLSDIALPEPGTMALFSLGLAGLGFVRRKRAA